MTRDGIHLDDADEAWIAKYRAAVKQVPVELSPSTRIGKALKKARTLVFLRISSFLERWSRTHSQKSPQSPAISVAQTQSPSNTAAHSSPKPSATGGLPPLTAEALTAQSAEGWREKPVA